MFGIRQPQPVVIESDTMDWYIEIGLAALGILSTICTFMWKKIIKPLINVLSQHDMVVQSINIIRDEILPEDGDSLKDTVCSLRGTCENIEKTQKVLEQRARASLHYSDQALFETDRDGQLIWTNEAFFTVTGETLSNMSGYDWITLIQEEEREKFLTEFASCIGMGRKLEIDTMSSKDTPIKLVGFPFKASVKEHDGFLISIHYEGEENE